ncbi:MAG: nitroreductase family deazaflavin-dependent oxidoreductase [Actinobacteria bacterium]|nr:nitroreductase family deazaflavin-dependent oxidoreductase [Actinomycetota bacterium]
MPMPRWFAQVNKRFFNKMSLKKDMYPVLTHTGRQSGKTYRVPLAAYAVDGGYIFILMYSAKSDWVRNVLASETALLTIDGDDVELVKPRLVAEDLAWSQMPSNLKPPPKFLHVTEFLKMDLAS